jgi:cytoplasmic iron level regulating protein YaaA (DUF328/UPF0246 family)
LKFFLAPAKNMRPAPAAAGRPLQRPRFQREADRLAEDLRRYSAWELEGLLRVNSSIAWRAFSDYQSFSSAGPGSPALLAYSGLAYTHLAPDSFTPEDLAFAENRLFILSALYGLLGPSDEIFPHRLELQIPYRYQGQTLYQFWGEKPCRALFSGGETVVNLASAEYARLILPFLQRGERLIQCVFCEYRGRRRVTLPTFAKMARGAMARFIIRRRLTDARQLWDFQAFGYAFVPGFSDEERYVFVRREEG